MRDSGYSRWKKTRNVSSRWIEKVSLFPTRLEFGNLRSTSWWSILDVLDMSVHHGSYRNFQWWDLQTSILWQRITLHCNTTDKKWSTDTWWRTVENESWFRSHLTWWTCVNLFWALLQWKHRDVTIIFNHDHDRIIFRNETVNLVSHNCHSYLHITRSQKVGDEWRERDKWRGWRDLRKRWKRERDFWKYA